MKSRINKKHRIDPEKASVRFEVYGREVCTKIVKKTGNSGRVYLPLDWIGCRVKIVRTN